MDIDISGNQFYSRNILPVSVSGLRHLGNARGGVLKLPGAVVLVVGDRKAETFVLQVAYDVFGAIQKAGEVLF
jgi:hypothetical protein